MPVLNAVMVPHPPLIIPEVGKGGEKKIQKTVEAYKRAAEFIHAARPETVVITTPHSVMYYDWFHISPGAGSAGNFSDFDVPEVTVSADYDSLFVIKLSELAKEEHFPAGREGERNMELDHATMIPIYFLKEAYGDDPMPKVVRVGLSGMPLADHYYLGMMIKKVSDELGRKISVIASGDLSHRLLESGPYGFNPAGPEYDEKIMKVMGNADFGKLFDFSEGFCESAGECGHRSFTIMAGCFDGVDVKSEALSYEGPFGVGYGVCLFSPGEADDSRHFLDGEIDKEDRRIAELRDKADPYARLARKSVETYVASGEAADMPSDLPAEMTENRAGVFVSLHLGGRLRGCIGTISPATGSIAQEIINNGISACSRDPRFDRVTEEELPHMEYSVDVLGEPEPVDGIEDLDPKKYGVIVSCGERRGLLLPDLDGVDTAEEQVDIARRKGSIDASEDYSLERFEVVRHV